jgi:hypothetical protein
VHFRILTTESRIELFDLPPRSAAANAAANSGMAVSASTGLSPSSRQRRFDRGRSARGFDVSPRRDQHVDEAAPVAALAALHAAKNASSLTS